jgi:hypothetical protein
MAQITVMHVIVNQEYKVELQNLFQKKIKRKNFFVTLTAATAGYMVMKTALYKIFGNGFAKDSSDSGKINVKINSLAVSRKKLHARQTKTGDANV